MTVSQLQRQAAASTDELLRISADIETYVIDAYGKVPKETFDLQCRLQRARCQKLENSLRQTAQALNGVPRTGMQAESIVLTLQLIAQNQLLLQQKEELLENFLSHADHIKTQLGQAKDIRDQEELVRLQTALREELNK